MCIQSASVMFEVYTFGFKLETVDDHMPKIRRYGTLCKHILKLCVSILHSIHRPTQGFAMMMMMMILLIVVA